jgi:hypothetical protein
MALFARRGCRWHVLIGATQSRDAVEFEFSPADRAFSDSDSEGRSLAAASGAATAAAQTDSRSCPGLVTTAIRRAFR